MVEDIKQQVELINRSLSWADKFNKEAFPREELKEMRRRLRRISSALDENCSAAAYGESQVGKSYLISSLLSTADEPFVIENDGKKYSFIDQINPSGGNNSETESTGIITRFTINHGDDVKAGFIKIRLLSIADIVMMLVDSYYNDLKLDATTQLTPEQINSSLDEKRHEWAAKEPVQQYLTEDDIKDICDYIKDETNAITVFQSNFRTIVSKKIQFISQDQWCDVFSLLWNKNPEFSRLFTTLIHEYAKLGFNENAYVPFSSVQREKGSLLMIEWLNKVCGIEVENAEDDHTKWEYDTAVYDSKGNLLSDSFPKSYLSALIAELTFILPESVARQRKFLHKLDLLDFPGARSRRKVNEKDVQNVIPIVLRRGKVAYLFHKYDRSLRISSILFCHHNKQQADATLGNLITSWIEANIGKTPQERAQQLKRTNAISPLFMVATKFNIELERTKNDTPTAKDALVEHWKRFTTVLPEIIKPATWLDNWVASGDIFSSTRFQHIYPLRDYYWSAKRGVFDGYSDGEIKSSEMCVHAFNDYPQYFEDLHQSFIHLDFVKQHFRDPEATWKSVATINCDGSRPIIRDLDSISGYLDEAREKKYLDEVQQLKQTLLSKLNVFYEPGNKEENNNKTRRIIGDIRIGVDSNIGERPEVFGRIIDQMMIPVVDLRRTAYEIISLRSMTPIDFNKIALIRQMAGVDPHNSREDNIKRLCNYYICDSESELEKKLQDQDMTLEAIISEENNVPTNVADLVSMQILDQWSEFLNKQVKELNTYIPHSDEVVFMLQTLCRKLGVMKVISDKIKIYCKMFKNQDDLPNAIADFASLTLNNFVSSVGNAYLTEEDLSAIEENAKACHLTIARPVAEASGDSGSTNVEDALHAFDEAVDDVNKTAFETLQMLPFWKNFVLWKGELERGLLLSADVSHSDPVANAIIKQIIDGTQSLYQS